MRKVLFGVLIPFLASVLIVHCSQQPLHHVGEWESKIDLFGEEWHNNLYFAEDGTYQRISGFDLRNPVWVQEGRYKIDYTRNPATIDLSVNGLDFSSYGIIRFLGGDKGRMELLFGTFDDKRPTTFESDLKRAIWTKKVKK